LAAVYRASAASVHVRRNPRTAALVDRLNELDGADSVDVSSSPAGVVAPRVTAAVRPRRPAAVQQEQLPLGEAVWRFPSLSLLKPAPARNTTGPSVEALQANARLLEGVLGDYGVQGAIREIRPGP